MHQRAYGDKYESGLDVAEVAKRIRKDIAAAIKAGDLPEIKTSVRIRRFSGGQSCDVSVKAVPAGFFILNPARIELDELSRTNPEEWKRRVFPDGYRVNEPGRYTERAIDLLKRLGAIVNAYNFDGSDSQTDYFDVNFYGNVHYDYSIENRQRETIKAALV